MWRGASAGALCRYNGCMAGGKSSPPLFELLGQGKGESISRQAKSFIPGASPAPDADGGSAGRGGDGAPSAGDGVVGGGGGGVEQHQSAMARRELGSLGSDGALVGSKTRTALVLSRPQALIGVGCLIGLIVLVWTLAYGSGARSKEAEWQRLMQRDQRIGPDPLVGDGSQGGRGDVREPRTEPRPPGTGGLTGGGGGGGGLLGAGTGGFILSAGGVLPKDPRQPGQNYLRLATLPRADAQAAIEYLAAGGVESIGVPVDPGTASANNPTRYAVFAMVGITGEEYKNRRPVMTDIEAKVARIGERYRREAKGPTDFSKPLWTKFNP